MMTIRFYHYRRVIVITVLSLFMSLPSHSQYRSAVKVHTFRVIGGLYTIAYEHAFSEHLSAELSLQGGDYYDLQMTRSVHYGVEGIGAIGALRYYPFTKNVHAPRGFFGYTALRYIAFDEAYRNTAVSERYEVGGNMINAGLGIGYKFVYRRVGLEAFVGWGTGRMKSEDDEYRNRMPVYHQQILKEQEHFPQLDVAVCYMFGATSGQ